MTTEPAGSRTGCLAPGHGRRAGTIGAPMASPFALRHRVACAGVAAATSVLLLGACSSGGISTGSASAELQSTPGGGGAPGGSTPGSSTPGGSTSTTTKGTGTTTTSKKPGTTTTKKPSTTSTTADDDSVIRDIVSQGLLTVSDMPTTGWEASDVADSRTAPVVGATSGGVMFDAEDCPEVVAAHPVLKDETEYPTASVALGAETLPDGDFNRTFSEDVLLFPDVDTATELVEAALSDEFLDCFRREVSASATGDVTVRTSTGVDVGDGRSVKMEVITDTDTDGAPDTIFFYAFQVDRALVLVVLGQKNAFDMDSLALAQTASDQILSVL